MSVDSQALDLVKEVMVEVKEFRKDVQSTVNDTSIKVAAIETHLRDMNGSIKRHQYRLDNIEKEINELDKDVQRDIKSNSLKLEGINMRGAIILSLLVSFVSIISGFVLNKFFGG